MAKKPANKPKSTTGKPKATTKPKAGSKKNQSLIAKLVYTASLEVEVDIEIQPGYTAIDVLDAIRSGKADFQHQIPEIAIQKGGKKIVLAKISPNCSIAEDVYDDFDIEPR
jgi:hypothetical protein